MIEFVGCIKGSNRVQCRNDMATVTMNFKFIVLMIRMCFILNWMSIISSRTQFDVIRGHIQLQSAF